MKKTLVALSVLAAASAQAGVEIYNKDNSTVTLSGDIEVRYVQAREKNAELTQDINDSDLKFEISHAVNDDFSVGGTWALDDISTKAEGGDAYVSFVSQAYGTLSVGKTTTQMDDAGIGSDKVFGLKEYIDSIDFDGDEVVKYNVDKGDFYLGLAYMQDKNNNNNLGADGNYLDAQVGARLLDSDLEVTAFYGSINIDKAAVAAETDVSGNTILKAAVAAVDKESTLMAIEATYSGIENVNLQAGYYNRDEDDNSGATKVNKDSKIVGLAADYTSGDYKYAAGYSMIDNNGTDHNEWFANVQYTLTTNTVTYIEIGDSDVEASGSDPAGDFGFAFGITSKF